VDQLGNQAKSLLIRVEGVEPPRARSRKQVKEEEEDDDDDDGVGETDEDFSSSTKSNGYSSSFQDQGLSEDRNMDLLYLAHEGRLDEMRLMLEDGADVNFADFDDRTALHVAACEGKANVVSFLIQKGANVNAKDRWGSTVRRNQQMPVIITQRNSNMTTYGVK
jgi:ankyrin repeat protein